MRFLLMLALLILCCTLARSATDLSEPALDSRIEQLRKSDFKVRLRDAKGRPVAASISYRLVRHSFIFGTAVADILIADPSENPDARKYQEILRSYFNCAVAENAHKWRGMEREPGSHADTRATAYYEKCRELGFTMRGHCVFWGVDRHVQPWVKDLDARSLEAAMHSRLERVLGLLRGKITEWDLNNEMMHQDYYGRTLGMRNGADYFKWAVAYAPENKYFVNEYGVLQGDEVDRYVKHMEDLLASGARVDGIGDQAHFINGHVPESEKLWAILDKLGKFGLPVKITEFDINTKDEQRQAEDTRRFYKLCFAHPSVHGILMWGFWEGRHWIPDAALWRKDWSIKPNGEAYVRLMSEWSTEGDAHPDKAGIISFRGFYGDYEFTSGSHTWRASLTAPGADTTAALVDDERHESR